MEQVIPIMKFTAEYYALGTMLAAVTLALVKAPPSYAFTLIGAIVLMGITGESLVEDYEFENIEGEVQIVEKRSAGKVTATDIISSFLTNETVVKTDAGQFLVRKKMIVPEDRPVVLQTHQRNDETRKYLCWEEARCNQVIESSLTGKSTKNQSAISKG